MADLFSERRSIRRFTSQHVEQEKLAAILTAAQMAPSWANRQCWELLVIQNEKTRQQLSELLSAKNPATLAMQNAPLVIGVAGTVRHSGFYKDVQVTRYGHWFLYDLGIVSQNICLKAWELGLGSVIIGSFAHEKAEQLLGIPEGVELVSLIPIGYPDHQPTAPKRRMLSEFVHYDQY